MMLAVPDLRESTNKRNFQLPNGKDYDFQGTSTRGIASPDDITALCEKLEILDTDTLLADEIDLEQLDIRSTEPSFFGPDGTVFNRYYQSIPFQQDMLFEKMRSFPEPTDFDSFAEYEENLLQWTSSAQQLLQSVKPPSVVAGHLFRPYALDAEAVLDGKKNLRDLEEYGSVALGPEENEKPLNYASSGILHFPASADPAVSDTPSDSIPDQQPQPQPQPQLPPQPQPPSVSPDAAPSADLDTNADPWQAMLFPAEPRPDQFQTFVEYDVALQHWAITCSQTLPFIPPHPSQLQQLLGLKTARTQRFRPLAKGRTMGRMAPRQQTFIVPSEQAPLSGNAWTNMTPDQQTKLCSLLSFTSATVKEGYFLPRRIREGETEETVRMLRALEVLPKLHGIAKQRDVSNSVISYLSGIADAATPSSRGVRMAGKGLLAVRRRDMTAEMLMEAQDCPSTVHGSEVLFPVPQVDTPLGDVLARYAASPATKRHRPTDLIRQKHALAMTTQFDHLNSWYHPLEPPERWNSLVRECAKIFESAEPVVDLPNVEQMLRVEVPLDKFLDWCDDERMRRILMAMSPQKLVQLVGMWQDDRPMDLYLHNTLLDSPDPICTHTAEFLFLARDPLFTTRTWSKELATPEVLNNLPQTRIEVTVRGSLLSWKFVERQANTPQNIHSIPNFLNLCRSTVELRADEAILVVNLSGRGCLVLRPFLVDDEMICAKAEHWKRILDSAASLPSRPRNKQTPPLSRTALLFNAKLAHIVQEAMLNPNKISTLLEYIKATENSIAMFQLARALCYRCEERNPASNNHVFEYSPHMKQVSTKVLGEEITKTLDKVMCLYYCQRMLTRASKKLLDNSKYKDSITKLLYELTVQIDEDCFSFPQMIDHLVACLLPYTPSPSAPKLRSAIPAVHLQTLCTVCTFAIRQVMAGPPSGFREQLCSTQTNFVAHVLTCCRSHRRSSRESGVVLMQGLMNSDWSHLIAEHYTAAKRAADAIQARPDKPAPSTAFPSLFDDMCSKDVDAQPLHSQLICAWLKNLLDHTSFQNQARIMFLFPLRIFQKLMQHVSETRRTPNWSTFVAAEIMVRIAKRCAKLGLLETATVVRSSQRDKALSDSILVIVPQNIMTLLEISTTKSDIQLRSHAIACLRHLVKSAKVLTLLKSTSEKFLTDLSLLCTEKVPIDYGLVQNSWKLLFQLARYHPNEIMKQQRSINQFLQGVHPQAGIVPNTYGLHYLAKLLVLKESELGRADQGRDVMSEATIKTFDKLSRQIAGELQLIHLHMLYANLCPDSDHRDPKDQKRGASFQKLAKLFHIFLKSPSCNVVLTNLRSTSRKKGSSDYLVGVQRIGAMFEASNT